MPRQKLEEKICPRCKVLKSRSKFYIKNGKIDDVCKICKINSRGDSVRLFLQAALRKVRYRSKKYKHDNELDINFLLDIYNKQKGKCAITGLKMTYSVGNGWTYKNVSIDRIDPTKGYTKENVQLVCWIINIMKHDLTDLEFRNYCKLVLG